jgi:hypothetical protein
MAVVEEASSPAAVEKATSTVVARHSEFRGTWITVAANVLLKLCTSVHWSWKSICTDRKRLTATITLFE